MFTLLYTVRVMEFSTSITRPWALWMIPTMLTCSHTYTPLEHQTWSRNPCSMRSEQGLKILKIQRGFIGDVQQCEWIWHRYDWEHQWCTIQKLTKKAPMNANHGPEILKIQMDIIGETQQCESGPEILKIQRDLISKVWQRDSVPQILKNQWGLIGEVRGCDWIWPRNTLGSRSWEKKSLSPWMWPQPRILKMQRDVISDMSPVQTSYW